MKTALPPIPPADATSSSGIRRSMARAEQKQQTKARLFDAAIELFRTLGYQETTVDQIVRKAGTSRPTFYAYFRDKFDLSNQIGDTLAPQLIPVYALIDRIEAPTLADVRRWLDAMVEFRRENRVQIEAASSASLSDADTARHYVDILTRNTETYMPNYLARFRGAARDAARARLILMMLQTDRYLFITQVRDASFPLPNMLDVAAELWWNTLFRDMPPTTPEQQR